MSRDALVDWHSPDLATQLPIERMLLDQHTGLQHLQLVETRGFGRAFLLDGHLMSSEGDEFFYHEHLAQLPAISHPNPVNALIIGGGDGGSARQLLMHQSIRDIQICELDVQVLTMARQHLPGIHHGSLEHPRVRVQIGDGLKYVRQYQGQVDLIILDLTDPQGPSAPLYDRHFFAHCARVLGEQGILSLHLCSPQLDPARFSHLLAELTAVFRCVRPMLVPIALYGGLWSLACASQSCDPMTLHPETIQQRLHQRQITGLRYYNQETHAAVFALPNFVRDLLPSSTP